MLDQSLWAFLAMPDIGLEHWLCGLDSGEGWCAYGVTGQLLQSLDYKACGSSTWFFGSLLETSLGVWV